MKIFYRKVLPLMVLAAGVFGFVTLKQRTVAGPSLPHSFYYYPGANVYFNVSTGRYIYPGPDGNWAQAEQLPYHPVSGLDKKVSFSSSTDPVWKENERHQMVYAASLFASASDLVQKPAPAPRVKVEPVKNEEAKASKGSGIKRFFKKLFKKKDQENPEDTSAGSPPDASAGAQSY
ncbi:MAG TPA: hypothetical protein VFR58_08485 [Flavisolibacter sp.]|nr:hypothetical protein [Flavisolibacter sp.]